MSEMNGGDGAVVFDITARTTGFENALQSITQMLNGAANNWDLVIESFAINMGLRISNAINDAVNEGIDLASHLEEIQNRINVAFGEEGAKKIDEWAKTVHDKFGISELQAKNYVSLLGSMFSASGKDKETALSEAIRVAERVGDLASLYDKEFNTVFQNVMSAISGSSVRSMYDYGVDLTKGTVEKAYVQAESERQAAEGKGTEDNPFEIRAWNDLSEAEQQTARINELLKQTDYVMGDFERTADSYANLGRRNENAIEAFILKLGQFFLPFKTNQRKIANVFLESLAYGFDLNKTLTTASTIVADARDPLTSLLGWWQTDALLQSAQKSAIVQRKEALLDSFWTLAEEGDTQTLGTVASAFLDELNKQIEEGNAKGENMGKYQRISNAYSNENFAEYSPDELYTAIQYLSDILSQTYGITGTEYENQIYNSLVTSIEEYRKSISDGAKSVESAGSSAASSITTAGSNVSSALNDVASSISSVSFNPLGWLFSGLLGKSHANGLDYVPYDGYRAILHQGERVQTAAEAELSRRYSIGQPQSFDYGAMGSAIGAHLPQGNMQIVWRGRVVADVLSEMQGDSYRALERSQWRS